MSVTLKYVGKKSEYVGKTLWEIVGNLKDFGVGRIFVRNMEASRYSEPCFMKILEVKAQPNEVPPKIEVIRPPNDLRDKDVSCTLVYTILELFDDQFQNTCSDHDKCMFSANTFSEV